MQPPRIETQRLLIKRIEINDSKKMYAYRSLPEVYKYQAWRPESTVEVSEFVQKINTTKFNVSDSWFQLGIYIKTTKQLIGDIGLHFLLPDNQQTETGFTIDPKYQRKGYGLECVRAVIGYLFSEMKKHRIVASVDPKNIASIALLEKLGMRKEGCFRKSVLIRDQWEDDMIYAILNEEWK